MAILGPKNKIGPPGEDGKDGRDGVDGRSGIDGRSGKEGTQWHSGKGAPPSVLGKSKDFYLDTAKGDVWEKSSIGWAKKINLRGPPGASNIPFGLPDFDIDGGGPESIYGGLQIFDGGGP